MRASLLPLLIATLPLLSAAARAELREFEGRLLIEAPPPFGERELANGVGLADVAPGVPLEALTLMGSIAGTTTLPVTDPTAAPLTGIRVQASMPSAVIGIDPFAPPFSGPAITGGALALHGSIRLCMLVAPLPPCLGGVSIPLTKGAGSVGVGIGGLLTVAGSTLRFSLYGAPFTLGTATLMVPTQLGSLVTLVSAGGLHGPLSFTSTAGRTEGGVGGLLAAVTPIRVVSSESIQGVNDFPGFLRLEIALLPEPGLPFLLGAGAGGLLLVGRRRSSSRHVHPPRSERSKAS